MHRLIDPSAKKARSFLEGPPERESNIRKIIFTAVAIAILSTPAIGAPCRDGKGKFVKCTTVKKTTVRCKANGKFAKCGTPGAKAI